MLRPKIRGKPLKITNNTKISFIPAILPEMVKKTAQSSLLRATRIWREAKKTVIPEILEERISGGHSQIWIKWEE